MAYPSLPPHRAASLDQFISGALHDLTEQLGSPPSLPDTERRVKQMRAAFSLALVKELRKMNQAASTICRLPSEIIGAIAAHLAFRDVVLAASICWRLRQVIVNTPSLWTHIPIICRTRSADCAQLDAFLARSGKMPVSVSLKGPSTGRQPSDGLSALPRCILDHLSHISSLSVKFDNFGFSVNNMIHPAPKLRSLTLRAPMVRYYLQRIPGHLCDGVLPNLTSVDLQGFALPKEPVEFASVRQLRIHAIPAVDHWGREHRMGCIAQAFPNLARLSLGKGPFPSLPSERLYQARGLEELLIGNESQFEFDTCGLRLDLIPRLVALGKTAGRALLRRTPPTAYFSKNAMEGLFDDGRVISVSWPNDPFNIRSSYCESILSAVIHIDHLRWPMALQWPQLESLEFEIKHPLPSALETTFSLSSLSAPWTTPALRTMRIVFTEDSRGRGTRVVFPSELVDFLRRFKIGQPTFATVELVNLHLWKMSAALSALVTDLLVDGRPYEYREIDARDSMHLIPPAVDAAMESDDDSDDAAAEDEEEAVDEDHSASDSESSASSSSDDSSSEDYSSSSSFSGTSSDSDASAASNLSSDVSNRAAKLSFQAAIGSEWKLLTSEFPARKIRDLLLIKS